MTGTYGEAVRPPSSAWDRLENPVEAALYDADPAYQRPTWVYPPMPWQGEAS